MPTLTRIRDFLMDAFLILAVLYFLPMLLGQVSMAALAFLVGLAVILLSTYLVTKDPKQARYIYISVVILVLFVVAILIPGTQFTLPGFDLPF